MTVGFDNNRQVGFVEFTDEFKEIYEQNLVESGPMSNGIFVLSPAYISDFPDENGVIHKAELIELSVIPAYQATNKR